LSWSSSEKTARLALSWFCSEKEAWLALSWFCSEEAWLALFWFFSEKKVRLALSWFYSEKEDWLEAVLNVTRNYYYSTYEGVVNHYLFRGMCRGLSEISYS
jgi:hypothetical protein